MLRIISKEKKIVSIENKTLKDAGYLEREDLQKMICSSETAFFEEMGEDLFLIKDEVCPTDFIKDRIDILALQKDGTSVIIELKRGENKLQLLQAISYASMISKWDVAEFLEARAQFSGNSIDDAQEEIDQFLDQIDQINKSQRVILIAEEFDYVVLSTAEWLTKNYGVDIRCYRLLLSADGEKEYLTCSCIYPPPEIREHAIKRGAKKNIGSTSIGVADWETILSNIANDNVADFVRSELDAGRKNNPNLKRLIFSIPGRSVGILVVQKARACFWQYKRFENDEEFWEQKIGSHSEPKSVNNGKSLRFYLKSKEDFQSFKDAFSIELPNVQYL